MAAKQQIFISRHFKFSKNLKNHFPKGIFQQNLAQLADYEDINIAEIKFG